MDVTHNSYGYLMAHVKAFGERPHDHYQYYGYKLIFEIIFGWGQICPLYLSREDWFAQVQNV